MQRVKKNERHTSGATERRSSSRRSRGRILNTSQHQTPRHASSITFSQPLMSYYFASMETLNHVLLCSCFFLNMLFQVLENTSISFPVWAVACGWCCVRPSLRLLESWRHSPLLLLPLADAAFPPQYVGAGACPQAKENLMLLFFIKKCLMSTWTSPCCPEVILKSCFQFRLYHQSSLMLTLCVERTLDTTCAMTSHVAQH